MAVVRGRAKRRHKGPARIEVRVQDETVALIDRLAAALGISRAAAVDVLVSRTPVDPASGLPEWFSEQQPDLLAS